MTCAACHGGGVDQQAAHYGNWAGSNMASAARDPVFRANEMIFNTAIKTATGKDGAGNMCFKCHSPNGWYSGRFDPTLAGAADGSTMLHSILLSTDDEGIMCDTCHRVIGAVTMQRPDLNPTDPVWNMLLNIDDWPHQGDPYPAGPTAGNPYGDAALQFSDGMAVNGRYAGTSAFYWSDAPLVADPMGPGGYSPGGNYTGQTYGVYPAGWIDAAGNDVGGQPAKNADGSTPIQFELPVGPPTNPDGTPCYTCQSQGPEHPTLANGFIESSEFCGSCHEVTVPVLNHGMPEQRTYTEWKYSAFGNPASPEYQTCQQCHMPRLQHELNDDVPYSYNASPYGEAGGWPFAKPRTNTAFHKNAGANRDLPMWMKILYPEIDLEAIGAPTGNDTRLFPGMLSDRSTMWERAIRNTEISMQESANVDIVGEPAFNATTGKWEVQVKVTNNSGHRVPSGYPDGRRLWINLAVRDETGAVVYESGHYDQNSAQLFTDSTMGGLSRALEPFIDGDSNAVMIYEKVTGACMGDPVTCAPSVSLLNDTILFDNRIPPFGFDYAGYSAGGAKFWSYDPATFVPYEDLGRYPDGQNFDIVTYTFSAPETAVLTARAELYWQTHTREFMEHLKNSDTSTLRPEGPPDIFSQNYPQDPTYLSDSIEQTTGVAFADLRDFNGQPLRDNWGGIAYAAWLLTNKGEPFLVTLADTAVAAPPAAPANVWVESIINPDTGLADPFTQLIRWDAVPGADGYLVWVRYGASDATASWDRLAIVYGNTELLNEALNVGKTNGYKVQAFNGKGFGPLSVAVAASTPKDLPLPPENLVVYATTATSISLSWYDGADNEVGFIIERQDVPVVGDFYPLADIPSQTAGGAFGGNNWTDTTAQPSRCYNYRVAAYNASGPSLWNINGPVQGCTGQPPSGPITLSGTAVSGRRVNLTWSGATGTITGYRVERSATSATGPWDTAFNVADPNATGHSDQTALPVTTYWYRVFAYNSAGDSPASNVVSVITPPDPPAAPGNLAGVANNPRRVTLTWTDNANNETGFVVERATGSGAGLTFAVIATINTPNTATYVDNTVEPKFTYTYRVLAFNAGGNSAYSNVAVVVTPGEPPQAPSNLRVTGVTRTTIALRWRDNATNEQGFYLERQNGNGVWVRIATLGRNVTSYTDRGLTRNTLYRYRVQAYNADGTSGYSNVVTIRTLR